MAISTDQGETWKHFQNLEALDNRVRIEVPSGQPNVIRMKEYGYRQPDPRQYPNAPGCLRICYATVAFSGDEVAICYDYGYGVGVFKNAHATRTRIYTLDGLYRRA